MQSPVSIKMGGYQNAASVHTKAARIFGAELNRRLKNNVTFEFQENIINQGHKAGDLLGMVEDGRLTMCYFSSSYLAERVAEFALLDLPFTYNDRQATYAILDGQLGHHLADLLGSSTGFKLLNFWDNGFRHFSNSSHPIESPSDCVDITIRTLFSDLHIEVFRSLGFVPVPLDVKDLLEGVRSGKIIAQENPLTNTYNFEIHKFHRYITLSSHFFGTAVLLCNQDTYWSWDEEFRAEIDRSAAIATEAQRRFASREDETILKKLSNTEAKITLLNEDQLELFCRAVEPVITRQKINFGDELFDMLY